MLPAGSHAGRRNLASIRVSTAHTCRTCHLRPLCMCLVFTGLGCCWLATGRVSAQLPPHCCCCWAQSAHHTNTHQTFREYTQTKLDICTLNFTYRFALTYSHISNVMRGPCLRCSKVSVLASCASAHSGCAGRRLRLRAEICQCPRRQNWIVSSQHRGATCLSTSRAGGHVMLIIITMGLHFACCH